MRPTRGAWLRGALLRVLVSAWALAAQAQGTRLEVPTREGVQVDVYWSPTPGARATLLMLPGGGGGYGAIQNGLPSSDNFLVRTVSAFKDAGFHVAIFGHSSDGLNLDYAQRLTPAHSFDVNAVVDAVGRLAPVPVWLVGTSRGTVSAAAAVIARARPGLAGVVLTSSITLASQPGALVRQDLAAIHIPVLMIQHRLDACRVCPARDLEQIAQKLVNAPRHESLLVEGGGPPSGNACGPRHWHGYPGIEQLVVDRIAHWIGSPAP